MKKFEPSPAALRLCKVLVERGLTNFTFDAVFPETIPERPKRAQDTQVVVRLLPGRASIEETEFSHLLSQRVLSTVFVGSVLMYKCGPKFQSFIEEHGIQ